MQINYPENASTDPIAPYNQITQQATNPGKSTDTIAQLREILGNALPDILITGTTGEHKINLTDNGNYDYSAFNHYDQQRIHAIENGDAQELGKLSYDAAVEYASACAKHHNETFDQIFND